MKKMLGITTAAACALAVSALASPPVPAGAAPVSGYRPVPAEIDGSSPDGLGDWVVRYQRVDGGDPAVAEVVNEVIDAEARGQVATYQPSATKTHHWTLDIDGVLQFRPMTISALFTGEYNTDMPNMPFHAVATRVFDNRSGILLGWDNLFVDKQAGLTRLSEQTKAILGGQFGSEVAPVDDNFRYWLPTDKGIELHFPEGQFGRGLVVITVPWDRVLDLIDPVFRPITG